MRYATGFRPGALSALATRVQGPAVYAALGAAAPESDLRAAMPPVMDQGQTGSCTGHALAAAVYAACQLAGRPLPWVPSPLGIYRLERAEERAASGAGTGTALTDSGAMPVDGQGAVQAWGVRPIQAPTSDGRYSDCEAATLDLDPGFTELATDALTLPATAAPVLSAGATRLADLAAALAGGHSVTLSVPGGSEAIQGYASGVLGAVDLATNPLDHYVALVAWDGAGAWTVRNSWGEGYGLGGHFAVSSDFLLSSVGDLFAWSAR